MSNCLIRRTKSMNHAMKRAKQAPALLPSTTAAFPSCQRRTSRTSGGAGLLLILGSSSLATVASCMLVRSAVLAVVDLGAHERFTAVTLQSFLVGPRAWSSL